MPIRELPQRLLRDDVHCQSKYLKLR
jgi:hypothetical protein